MLSALTIGDNGNFVLLTLEQVFSIVEHAAMKPLRDVCYALCHIHHLTTRKGKPVEPMGRRGTLAPRRPPLLFITYSTEKQSGENLVFFSHE